MGEPKQKSISVPLIVKPTREEFISEFRSKRRPVIVRGAMEQCNSLNWTLDYLIGQVGHREIGYRTTEGTSYASFEKLVNDFRNEESSPYLRQIHIKNHLPEILKDIEPHPSFILPDWRSHPLMPNNFILPKHMYELFIGDQRHGFPVLHIDFWGMDSFICQVVGTKHVTVLSPEDTPYVYPLDSNPNHSAVDVFNPDYNKHPEYRKASPVEVLLEPGDLLYCPNGWWHTTRMEALSMTVLYSCWHNDNWDALVNQWYMTAHQRPAYKTAIMGQYMKMIGSYLRSKGD